MNVTHGADLRFTVLHSAGSLTLSNISGRLGSYKGCPRTGQTETGGVLTSRFLCRCEDTCHLLLRLRYQDLPLGGDTRICTLKVYD